MFGRTEKNSICLGMIFEWNIRLGKLGWSATLNVLPA